MISWAPPPACANCRRSGLVRPLASERREVGETILLARPPVGQQARDPRASGWRGFVGAARSRFLRRKPPRGRVQSPTSAPASPRDPRLWPRAHYCPELATCSRDRAPWAEWASGRRWRRRRADQPGVRMTMNGARGACKGRARLGRVAPYEHESRNPIKGKGVKDVASQTASEMQISGRVIRPINLGGARENKLDLLKIFARRPRRAARDSRAQSGGLAERSRWLIGLFSTRTMIIVPLKRPSGRTAHAGRARTRRPGSKDDFSALDYQHQSADIHSDVGQPKADRLPHQPARLTSGRIWQPSTASEARPA